MNGNILWRSISIFKRGMAVKPAVKPAVKVNSPESSTRTSTKFDNNMPIYKRKKAWEVRGQDKETFFKNKYAHVHARENSDPTRDGYDNIQYSKRQAYYSKRDEMNREQQSQHMKHLSKFNKRNPVQGLEVNPLLEYVYGTNSVIAALRGNKREYYNIIFYHGTLLNTIEELAKEKRIELVKTDKHRLNIMTKDGVHNNVVLETKPLQPVEISYLGACSSKESTFKLVEEDEFNQNTADVRDVSYITNEVQRKKFPLGIYLDEVVDPHNIGAIIRSAFFLGVDFIVMSRKNCAPLSPVVNKTSSGALELLPIYYVDRPMEFFEKSQQAGKWTFVSSCLMDNVIKQDKMYIDNKLLALTDLSGICSELPVVLVVGNEGKGIRTNLRMRSDFYVEIPFGRPVTKSEEVTPYPLPSDSALVDSLNVSVATALLVNGILT